MYPLVALGFCLFREIAETHELSARKLLNEIHFNSLSDSSLRGKLEAIMHEFIDAHECYVKAGCHSHADSCGKFAQLVSLQIHLLPSNKIILNLKPEEVTQFIEKCINFHEVSNIYVNIM